MDVEDVHSAAAVRSERGHGDVPEPDGLLDECPRAIVFPHEVSRPIVNIQRCPSGSAGGLDSLPECVVDERLSDPCLRQGAQTSRVVVSSRDTGVAQRVASRIVGIRPGERPRDTADPITRARNRIRRRRCAGFREPVPVPIVSPPAGGSTARRTARRSIERIVPVCPVRSSGAAVRKARDPERVVVRERLCPSVGDLRDLSIRVVGTGRRRGIPPRPTVHRTYRLIGGTGEHRYSVDRHTRHLMVRIVAIGDQLPRGRQDGGEIRASVAIGHRESGTSNRLALRCRAPNSVVSP